MNQGNVEFGLCFHSLYSIFVANYSCCNSRFTSCTGNIFFSFHYLTKPNYAVAFTFDIACTEVDLAQVTPARSALLIQKVPNTQAFYFYLLNNLLNGNLHRSVETLT